MLWRCRYGIDFRASTDVTGNALSDGDWKMETDNDYDVSKDYLDAAKIKVYTEKMGLQSAKPKGWKSDYKAAGACVAVRSACVVTTAPPLLSTRAALWHPRHTTRAPLHARHVAHRQIRWIRVFLTVSLIGALARTCPVPS